MTLKPETGRYIVQLRDEAGMKQNELAKRVGWSPTVVSRIESGERPVTSDEIESILDAIGSDNAKEFKLTHDREWQEIERPVLGHPEESLLWEADEAIHEVVTLLDNPDIKNSFANRLREIQGGLHDAASLVRSTEHAVAFVGDIGVGKTTSICRALGLETRDQNKSTFDSVLEVGAGGVTVCEVHIVQGPEYGILVEPMSDSEIRREVSELATLIKSPPSADQDNEEPIGTSKEIDRAIRNMSDLTRRRRPVKGKDGKTTQQREDPVQTLANDVADTDTLVVEILARMSLASRTKRETWYTPTDTVKDPLTWLTENFRLINNGRHSDFSISKRIEIVIPEPVIDEKSLSVRVIDTKGIDRNAQRGDIENLFEKRNTVSLLCSPFNSIPSPSVQQILKRAAEGGYGQIGYKAAILGLPKHDEALAVRDDDGTPAEDMEDGYFMKSEQAEETLASIGAAGVQIEFFNAFKDSPERLRSFMLNMVKGLRKRNAKELSQAVEDARWLVENYEKEQTRSIQMQAAGHLKTWLDNNRILELTGVPSLERTLMNSITSSHAGTLRASVRREGHWDNLYYSHELSYGARLAAVRAVSSKLSTLNAIAEHLLQHSDLKDASGLVREVRRVVSTGVRDMYSKCAQIGVAHHSYMELDSTLWENSESEWGLGGGYRDRVAGHHAEWFNTNSLSKINQARLVDLMKEEWDGILDKVSGILDDVLSV